VKVDWWWDVKRLIINFYIFNVVGGVLQLGIAFTSFLESKGFFWRRFQKLHRMWLSTTLWIPNIGVLESRFEKNNYFNVRSQTVWVAFCWLHTSDANRKCKRPSKFYLRSVRLSKVTNETIFKNWNPIQKTGFLESKKCSKITFDQKFKIYTTNCPRVPIASIKAQTSVILEQMDKHVKIFISNRIKSKFIFISLSSVRYVQTLLFGQHFNIDTRFVDFLNL